MSKSSYLDGFLVVRLGLAPVAAPWAASSLASVSCAICRSRSFTAARAAADGGWEVVMAGSEVFFSRLSLANGFDGVLGAGFFFLILSAFHWLLLGESSLGLSAADGPASGDVLGWMKRLADWAGGGRDVSSVAGGVRGDRCGEVWRLDVRGGGSGAVGPVLFRCCGVRNVWGGRSGIGGVAAVAVGPFAGVCAPSVRKTSAKSSNVSFFRPVGVMSSASW